MGPAAALPTAPARDMVASENPWTGMRSAGVREATSKVEPATVVADQSNPSRIRPTVTDPMLCDANPVSATAAIKVSKAGQRHGSRPKAVGEGAHQW